jgi:hypothetical protein
VSVFKDGGGGALVPDFRDAAGAAEDVVVGVDDIKGVVAVGEAGEVAGGGVVGPGKNCFG